MLGLFFPERCGLCDRYLSLSDLGACTNCVSQLAGLTIVPGPGGVVRTAAGRYEAGLADAIQRLKFQRERWRGRALGLACPAPLGFDVLVPVPLHRRRLRERGFNQSAIIASALSRTSGVPSRPGLLRRIAYRPPQADRSAESRSDIANDFEGRSCAGLRVLVIDDVTTTGHTLAACRRALLSAGAADVRGFAVAFTERLGLLDGGDSA